METGCVLLRYYENRWCKTYTLSPTDWAMRRISNIRTSLPLSSSIVLCSSETILVHQASSFLRLTSPSLSKMEIVTDPEVKISGL